MENKSRIRQSASLTLLSVAILTVGLLNSAGARAGELRVSDDPVALIDFTCGDGMHFDFKQGCVTDATKLKKEVTRPREDRRVRPLRNRSQDQQTTSTEI